MANITDDSASRDVPIVLVDGIIMRVVEFRSPDVIPRGGSPKNYFVESGAEPSYIVCRMSDLDEL